MSSEKKHEKYFLNKFSAAQKYHVIIKIPSPYILEGAGKVSIASTRLKEFRKHPPTVYVDVLPSAREVSSGPFPRRNRRSQRTRFSLPVALYLDSILHELASPGIFVASAEELSI